MMLEHFGWNLFFADAFRPYAAAGCAAARVCLAHRGLFHVFSERGEIEAQVSGRFRHAASASAWPVVGDWVALRGGGSGAQIDAVLPRRSKFSRKQPGAATEEQILAANIDIVFLVCGLDGDFNLRRLERYLLLAAESGAAPVIVLNKADLRPHGRDCLEQAAAIAAGAPVVVVSALTGQGLERLVLHAAPGQTAALLGSSGAGKSTIVNRLLGFDAQRVAPAGERDGRGRHTTTHRQLILMPQRWLLMDLPGLRELQLWTDAEASDDPIEAAFPDIAALAALCRFRDCRHQGEPGCAVRQAIEEQRLDAGRLRSYAKLGRELDHLEARQDQRAAAEQKRRVKQMHRAPRQLYKRG